MDYKNLEEVSCIYAIVNMGNFRSYVGQTYNLRKRIRSHLEQFRQKRHSNIELQNDWYQYGNEKFYVEILELVNNENIGEKEQYWINFGCNLYNKPSKAKEISNVKKNDIERFYSKVLKTDTCWLWQGGLDKDGYGNFWLNNDNYKATRVSYYIKYGQFDYTKLMCHSCDNTQCVNPDHLFLGTTKDNSNDRIKKVRSKKINKEIAIFIRESYKKDNRVTNIELRNLIRDKFRVDISVGSVGDILCNKRWYDPNYKVINKRRSVNFGKRHGHCSIAFSVVEYIRQLKENQPGTRNCEIIRSVFNKFGIKVRDQYVRKILKKQIRINE